MNLENKNTLKEDLSVPLDKVQRWWLRIPATLILFVGVFVVHSIFNIIYHIISFFRMMWKDVFVEFLFYCLKNPRRII